jgi:hypothetical protein
MLAMIVGVVVLALLGVFAWQQRRSEALRARYGPEYERTVHRLGDKRRGESELLKRQERVAHLDIVPLSAQQENAFLQEWRAVQTCFVDDPKRAVTDADRVVEDMMKARGYPIAEFEQRAADLSVHHPRAVENYRAAHDIAQRYRRGQGTTEDLRQAMVHYRGLFQDLIEDREHAEREVPIARSAIEERVVERVVERDVERDADRLEIPVKRAGERASDRDIRNDREVRP